MRILVTGATGFVGACLARRFLQQGHEVHTFTRKTSNLWRLREIQADIVEHNIDLRDADTLNQVVQKIRPQLIYHCATYGGFAYQKETTTIMETNFIATVNLLKACEKTGFDYFVNTGSSSEYGIKAQPIREQDNLEPVEDYGVSKAAATLFCQSEGRTKHLPIVTLRLFSPFGPWDDPRRLVPYVITSFLKGDIPRLSSPASVRDYVFIDDVLDAYISVVDYPFFGEIFNIGSGKQSSVENVVTAIKDILQIEYEPVWGVIAKQRTEPEVWVSQIDKAREKFNWQPSMPFRDGMEKTISWMKNNLLLYSQKLVG